jgi:3-oxoacyl-[acyl-carrier protein] reductase
VPNLNYDFRNRSVIVTGGARGIGQAIAERFCVAGADVWLVDVDGAEVREVAQRLGSRWAVADVSATSDVEHVVRGVIEESGRVDVVVNNAGLLRDRVLWRLDDDDWEAVLAVHLGGTFRFTRACVPHFREQAFGRVINVTSYTGLHGNIGQAAYAAAKAGIIGFTKTAAKELARFGVTVNAISPNAETRMIAGVPPDKRLELEAQIPLGRFADPSEISAAVAFLASEEANYITGEVVRVDGGLAM